MGSLCNNVPQHLPVLKLPNFPFQERKYQCFRGQSLRFGEISVTHTTKNNYDFLIGNADQEFNIQLPVLTEIAHCALHSNYRLKLSGNMCFDLAAYELPSTLIEAQSQITERKYTLRIVPFKSYSSPTFKRALYEVWLLKNSSKQKDILNCHELEDVFVASMDSQSLSIVMLFERMETSLANVIEYRAKANWPWTETQKIKIIFNLLQTIAQLHQKKIYHRGIRAGNVLFVKDHYVLGSFSNACLISQDLQDLHTVSGVEENSEDKLSALLKDREKVGIYNILHADYYGLKSVMRAIQNLSLFDHSAYFSHALMENVYLGLEQKRPLSTIVQYLRVNAASSEIHFEECILLDDLYICRAVPNLVRESHKQTIEQFLFTIYGSLSYYKEYSELAHHIMEVNNEKNRPLENAAVLRKLGQFYEGHGSNGHQYYLNSCILYCLRAEKAVRHRMRDRAQENIQKAEEVYIRCHSVVKASVLLVDIRRIRLLIKGSKEGEATEALAEMKKLLTDASKEALSTQRQLKLFLNFAQLLRLNKDYDAAVEQLRNGLVICQNKVTFQSAASCARNKGTFTFELGLTQLILLNLQNDPLKKSSEQNYSPILRTTTEKCLTTALDIRSQNGSDAFELLECYSALGNYHMLMCEYKDAATYLTRASHFVKVIGGDIHPQIGIKIAYDLGSVCYRSSLTVEAEGSYKQALDGLGEHNIDELWRHCVMGNYGLARILNGKEGDTMIEKAKEYIRARKGEKHYDYMFLCRERLQIQRKG